MNERSTVHATSDDHDARYDRFLREVSERRADDANIMAQAVDALPEWLASLANWDMYATLTYDQQRGEFRVDSDTGIVTPPSADACRRHASQFVKRAQESLQHEVGAVIALEYTRAGWPHFHGLIAAGSRSQLTFQTLHARWYERHGFIKLSRVGDSDLVPVTRYCAKYLTKSTGDLFFLGPLGEEGQDGQIPLELRRSRAE